MILGAVAGNVDDTAVFAKPRAKARAKTRYRRSRSQLGKDDPPEDGKLRRAEHAARLFIGRVQIFQDRLNGADDEGNADEDQGDDQADMGIGDGNAVTCKEASEEARIGIEL